MKEVQCYDPVVEHEGDGFAFATMEPCVGGAYVRLTTYEEVAARLVEAEAIILELENHEGAEGWSHSLRERLNKFLQTA